MQIVLIWGFIAQFSLGKLVVGGFITVCRLFLRIKMRGAIVEEQI